MTTSKTLRIQESNLSLAMKYDSPDNWAYWPDSNIEIGSRLKGELYPGISKLSTVYLLNGFWPISNSGKRTLSGYSMQEICYYSEKWWQKQDREDHGFGSL